MSAAIDNPIPSLPEILIWARLDAGARAAALARPALARADELRAAVARIIDQVRADGDQTLRLLTRRYDEVEIDSIELPRARIDAAIANLADDVRAAIDEAYGRIRAFHEAARPREVGVDTAPGVRCEIVWRPIATVGLYVPAGSAPLPSTALMLGVPAQIAGCREVVLCSPPDREGGIDAAVLYAARRCGIARAFRIGGAQAIAAMSVGTASVPRCDKLFGPGNAYVTEAKLQVAATAGGPAIDMPAGPSEVLVIADGTADPAFVAADLLAQAEHSPDAQAILLTDSAALAAAVRVELAEQLATLPRRAIAAQALAGSRLIVVGDLAEAVALSNGYAPEHLILEVAAPRALLARVESAGSVFLGSHTPESLGDYCSGTNHVLPTYGAARAWSGVSVASFMKSISVQEATLAGLAAIGPCAMTLARAEGLVAHERAVAVRLAGNNGATR